MKRLSDYETNLYSQFGEDGVIAAIFSLIGEKHRVAVEFGAGDGLNCSNTAHLWRDQDWRGFLVEPDGARFEQLEGNAGPFDTICRRAYVTPLGMMTIGNLLSEHDIDGVDFMSIDIDGDDIHVFRELDCRPRVVAVEFNPTIPPHLDVRPKEEGSTFGASALAIVRAGHDIGYHFVGATYCNAFFVDAAESAPFGGYETDLETLLAKRSYTYAVTDFAGKVVLVGEPLPWGARAPYIEPLAAGATVTHVTDNAQHLRRGFEALWGPAIWLPGGWCNLANPDGMADGRLQDTLASKPALVCLDVTAEPDWSALTWIWAVAERDGYRVITAGSSVIGLVRDQT